MMNVMTSREAALILHEWKEEVDLRACATTCPMPRCGALVIAYEPADSLNELSRKVTGRWDFVCSECGTEFSASKEDLLFDAVPRQWLLSDISHA
jgi:hypothetical protein